MTYGERIKEIRKHNNLTLEEFGKRIGVTKAAVSNIENGNRNATEQLIVSVCREFNISEEWLRTGEGNMEISLTRNQEIAQFTADLFKGEKDSFKERLILALSKLDESEWEVLEKIANNCINKKD